MSEDTTNLTKRLAGRFLKCILINKRWNLRFFYFSAKNLSRTEVTEDFPAMLWNWKFYEEHFLMKKLAFVSSFVVNEFFESRYVTGESFFHMP